MSTENMLQYIRVKMVQNNLILFVHMRGSCWLWKFTQ